MRRSPARDQSRTAWRLVVVEVASERLSAIESKVLKRDGAGQRRDILEMRRNSIRVARVMSYKRTAMRWNAVTHALRGAL